MASYDFATVSHCFKGPRYFCLGCETVAKLVEKALGCEAPFCRLLALFSPFSSFLIQHHITARASKEAPDLFPGRNPAVQDWNLAHPKLLTKLISFLGIYAGNPPVSGLFS